jgi:hypothetical protein
MIAGTARSDHGKRSRRESRVCWVGICEPLKCDDGVQNGDETGWECGSFCYPCP